MTGRKKNQIFGKYGIVPPKRLENSHRYARFVMNEEKKVSVLEKYTHGICAVNSSLGKVAGVLF